MKQVIIFNANICNMYKVDDLNVISGLSKFTSSIITHDVARAKLGMCTHNQKFKPVMSTRIRQSFYV